MDKMTKDILVVLLDLVEEVYQKEKQFEEFLNVDNIQLIHDFEVEDKILSILGVPEDTTVELGMDDPNYFL
ncbi:hypothetical protein [Shimazuella alba]|uniref:Uncharacterized protein n=1 Tax=Shimazuella alba TaxID=2690964 RepID=A0A6I4VRU5_9BACL|nr:hypothetical protein [Shimazuella alba]MXQ53168.1 hypothetical protein [Shimazuella alba]